MEQRSAPVEAPERELHLAAVRKYRYALASKLQRKALQSTAIVSGGGRC